MACRLGAQRNVRRIGLHPHQLISRNGLPKADLRVDTGDVVPFGERVVISPSISDEVARAKYPQGFERLNPVSVSGAL